ncbi:WXG100-like domain-containing protein, partial [Actinokineospora bangkokensis]
MDNVPQVGSIMWPSELNWLAPILFGDFFPKSREGDLFMMSNEWNQIARDITTSVNDLPSLISQAQQAMSGDSGRAFLEYGRRLGRAAPQLAKSAGETANTLYQYGLNVQKAKYSMIIAAVMTAAEIAWALSNPFTAPLVPGFIAAGQAAVRRILTSLFGRIGGLLARMALSEALSEAAQEFLAQLIQYLQGVRDKFNLEDLGQAFAIGGAAGVVAGGLHLGGNKVNPNFNNSRWGAGVNEGLTEIIVGAGAAAALGGDFDSLWAGGLNGFLSGAASHTKDRSGGPDTPDTPSGPDTGTDLPNIPQTPPPSGLDTPGGSGGSGDPKSGPGGNQGPQDSFNQGPEGNQGPQGTPEGGPTPSPQGTPAPPPQGSQGP